MSSMKYLVQAASTSSKSAKSESVNGINGLHGVMNMCRAATLEQIKVKLIAGGYEGLYAPGVCACELSDLAPCGVCENDGNYINGCKPGYKHLDQRNGHIEFGHFIVTSEPEQPTPDQFDCLDNC